PGNYSLIVQFIGYQKQKKDIHLEDNETISVNIELQTEAKELEKLVVVGYGEVEKKDLTGSITSIGSEKLQTSPTSSFDQLLGGKMAGVQVSRISGKPGAGAIINIRGAASISGDNQPLYVINGVPMVVAPQVPASFNDNLGAVPNANPLL